MFCCLVHSVRPTAQLVDLHLSARRYVHLSCLSCWFTPISQTVCSPLLSELLIYTYQPEGVFTFVVWVVDLHLSARKCVHLCCMSCWFTPISHKVCSPLLYELLIYTYQPEGVFTFVVWVVDLHLSATRCVHLGCMSCWCTPISHKVCSPLLYELLIYTYQPQGVFTFVVWVVDVHLSATRCVHLCFLSCWFTPISQKVCSPLLSELLIYTYQPEGVFTFVVWVVDLHLSARRCVHLCCMSCWSTPISQKVCSPLLYESLIYTYQPEGVFTFVVWVVDLHLSARRCVHLCCLSCWFTPISQKVCSPLLYELLIYTYQPEGVFTFVVWVVDLHLSATRCVHLCCMSCWSTPISQKVCSPLLYELLIYTYQPQGVFTFVVWVVDLHLSARRCVHLCCMSCWSTPISQKVCSPLLYELLIYTYQPEGVFTFVVWVVDLHLSARRCVHLCCMSCWSTPISQKVCSPLLYELLIYTYQPEGVFTFVVWVVDLHLSARRCVHLCCMSCWSTPISQKVCSPLLYELLIYTYQPQGVFTFVVWVVDLHLSARRCVHLCCMSCWSTPISQKVCSPLLYELLIYTYQPEGVFTFVVWVVDLHLSARRCVHLCCLSCWFTPISQKVCSPLLYELLIYTYQPEGVFTFVVWVVDLHLSATRCVHLCCMSCWSTPISQKVCSPLLYELLIYTYQPEGVFTFVVWVVDLHLSARRCVHLCCMSCWSTPISQKVCSPLLYELLIYTYQPQGVFTFVVWVVDLHLSATRCVHLCCMSCWSTPISHKVCSPLLYELLIYTYQPEGVFTFVVWVVDLHLSARRCVHLCCMSCWSTPISQKVCSPLLYELLIYTYQPEGVFTFVVWVVDLHLSARRCVHLCCMSCWSTPISQKVCSPLLSELLMYTYQPEGVFTFVVWVVDLHLSARRCVHLCCMSCWSTPISQKVCSPLLYELLIYTYQPEGVFTFVVWVVDLHLSARRCVHLCCMSCWSTPISQKVCSPLLYELLIYTYQPQGVFTFVVWVVDLHLSARRCVHLCCMSCWSTPISHKVCSPLLYELLIYTYQPQGVFTFVVWVVDLHLSATRCVHLCCMSCWSTPISHKVCSPLLYELLIYTYQPQGVFTFVVWVVDLHLSATRCVHLCCMSCWSTPISQKVCSPLLSELLIYTYQPEGVFTFVVWVVDLHLSARRCVHLCCMSCWSTPISHKVCSPLLSELLIYTYQPEGVFTFVVWVVDLHLSARRCVHLCCMSCWSTPISQKVCSPLLYELLIYTYQPEGVFTFVVWVVDLHLSASRCVHLCCMSCWSTPISQKVCSPLLYELLIYTYQPEGVFTFVVWVVDLHLSARRCVHLCCMSCWSTPISQKVCSPLLYELLIYTYQPEGVFTFVVWVVDLHLSARRCVHLCCMSCWSTPISQKVCSPLLYELLIYTYQPEGVFTFVVWVVDLHLSARRCVHLCCLNC